MESRVEKHHNDELMYEETTTSTRSGRNAKLYKQVYGKYGDLDNLPIEDNTDEIDMEKLRELVLHNNHEQEDKELKQHLNVLEQKKRKIDEQRVYDINKILEKAKNENNKLKDTSANIPKINRDILSTLQSKELSLEEIKKASQAYQEKSFEPISYDNVQEENIDKLEDDATSKEDYAITKEEQISITRELKYKDLGIQLDQEQESSIQEKSSTESTAELSLDLFADLKPTGNTIVTKPIKADEPEIKQISGIHSSDTRDIDIIKKEEKNPENDFFTSSYHFTKNDFASDDDFYDTPKKGGLFKILLLLLAITVFIGVIVYFVGTYGLGI